MSTHGRITVVATILVIRVVRDGVIYLVAGGGRAPLYPPPDRGGFYHYVRITVRGQETSDEVVRLP